MFSDLKTKGSIMQTNLRKFLCDESGDIEQLPTTCSPGSLAYVIATGKNYILNNAHKWKERVPRNGNSGFGSGSGTGTGGGSSSDWEPLPSELSDTEIDEIFNS